MFPMINIDILTYKPIDIAASLALLRSSLTGGLVLFSGEVRNINNGREVCFLEYEAYEAMARKKIIEIVQNAINNWNLNDALCIHRLGRLEIADCAVLVITASVHRAEAYEANRYIIDLVKKEVPIWKKEYFTDGTFEWGVNNECNCSVNHEHKTTQMQSVK